MAEDLLHFGSVKLRITGSANLDMQLIGLDDTITQDLFPLPITTTSGREPVRLSNMIGQRARLKLSTDAIDEWINVNRIIIYVKPTYTSYPLT